MSERRKIMSHLTNLIVMTIIVAVILIVIFGFLFHTPTTRVVILILTGAIMGPILVGLLYIRLKLEADESHTRASLYADLLMHDISNHNQSVLTALELLGYEGISEEMRAEIAGRAYQMISRSSQLIRNVRILGEADILSTVPLTSIDLVSSLVEALDEATRLISTERVKLQFKHEGGRCYVLANKLITEVFRNLLDNTLQHPPDDKIVSIEIKSLIDSGIKWWQIRFADRGRWIEPRERPKLFEREVGTASGSALGLLVVRVLTESFGGYVAIDDTLDDEFSKGTVFVVNLPAVEEFEDE